MITATVKIDLSALKHFKDKLNKDLRAGGQITGGSPINNAIKQWGVRYRSFIRERFIIYSRGGGNWPPLKPLTIKRKLKGKKKGKSSILIDTGQMFAALDPIFTSKPGALNEKIPFGVRIGYGGPGVYTKKYGGAVTIADVAHFHQTGAGRLPKREIIVPPDAKTVELMTQDMNRAVLKTYRNIVSK